MHTTDPLALFVQTVDCGSFVAAGLAAGITASAAARIVSRLESQLGVKLLARSTRRLVLTQEGEAYLPHARAALAALAAGQDELAASQGRVQGLVRVNTGTAFARHRLARLLPAFHARYPGVQLDLTVTDRRIDPEAQQFDVTIRVGPLADSGLILKPLGTVRRIMAASPAYLARRGMPRTPLDLLQHDCLLLKGFARLAQWPMLQEGRRVLVPVAGSVRADSADVLLDLAVAGMGIVWLGDFLGEQALANGQLVPVLAGQYDDDPQPLSALILPGRQQVARVRAFVDFLAEALGSAKAPAH
ncbi:MAG: LysR family transcriptional regulator [Ramlibacter sp.]